MADFAHEAHVPTSVNLPPTGVPWRRRSPLKHKTVHLASGSRFSSANSQTQICISTCRFREHPRTLVLYDFKSCSGPNERRNRKKLEKHGKADNHDTAPVCSHALTSCYYWLRISRKDSCNSSVCVAPMGYPVTPLTKISPSLPEQMPLSPKHFRE